MIEIFFQNIPSFTFVQFIQTWGLLSVVVFIFFGMSDRFIRFMPWLAMWLVMTPERPVEKDILLMALCWLATELVYQRVCRVGTNKANVIPSVINKGE